MEQRIAPETIVATNNGSKVHYWRTCLLFSGLVLLGLLSVSCSDKNSLKWINVPRGICEFGEKDSAQLIKVNSFNIAATPITNEQFSAFVNATNYCTIAEKEGSAYFDTFKGWQIDLDRNWKHPQGKHSSITDKMDHPVVCVSYDDAIAYCKWANVRLPNEVEWEYVCEQESPSTTNINISNFNNTESKDTFIFTSPVHYFEPSKNGIYCQLGNVWEICEEQDQNIGTSAQSSQKVIKGGSFLCTKEYCHGFQSNARQIVPKNEAFFHVGFRVVKDVE